MSSERQNKTKLRFAVGSHNQRMRVPRMIKTAWTYGFWEVVVLLRIITEDNQKQKIKTEGSDNEEGALRWEL